MTDWRGLTSALAAAPPLFERLLALHVPDGNGRCRACTTPGYGTPHVAWPCVIQELAARAAAVDGRATAQLRLVTKTIDRRQT